MRFNLLNRKVHDWASAVVAPPLLVIIGSGISPWSPKQWSWVQPPELRGSGTVPSLDLEGILASVRSVPDLGVMGWDDVNRLDLRPGRGVAKVWLQNGYEVQVDLGSGRVLQTAYRRSDFIESMHDGSFFAGDWSKLGLFLPAGVVLLLLWLSGLWMFVVPLLAKRRVAVAREGPDARSRL